MAAKSEDSFARSEESITKIIGLINMSQLLYVVSSGIVKDTMSVNEVSIAEQMFVRYFTILCFSSVIYKVLKVDYSKEVLPEIQTTLWLRSSTGTVNFALNMVSILTVPVSIYWMLCHTTPFLTAILGCLWLNERIELSELLAIGGSLIGIALIALGTP
jgi:drug/metabolite transporter (DMT)-like permease